MEGFGVGLGTDEVHYVEMPQWSFRILKEFFRAEYQFFTKDGMLITKNDVFTVSLLEKDDNEMLAVFVIERNAVFVFSKVG